MKALPRSMLLALVLPVMISALVSIGPGSSNGDDTGGIGLAERMARLLSAEMRRDEERLRELDSALAGLPELQASPAASRYGFRSNPVHDEGRPHWAQLDLGRRRLIDRVVAVPVHIPSLGTRGKGYGFPRRFRIEVSDDPNMKDAVPIVDRSAEDMPNPGIYPLIFNLKPIEARYVRFTSTKHFHTTEGYIWALEELMLLSGNSNIGVGAEVRTTNSLELFPNWSKARINDGQSALGMPVTVEHSPTSGYASAITDNARERKTLTVDLGREFPIDEVRWLPVESANFEMPGWHSFTRACTIEIARAPDLNDATMLAQNYTSNWPGYPGHCALIAQGGGKSARYVRLVTRELWGVDNLCGFAVSEVQVYSNGSNISLGKQVMATDISDRDDAARWSPSFAVDGYNSRHRLIEYPEHLELIVQRQNHQLERDQIITRKNSKARAVERTLTYGGISLGAVALLGGSWMFLRGKRLRIDAVKRLREQIARDLHDDIGSNLGGIVLLSDMGSRHSKDEQARQDFQTILEAAEQTSQSMQDIVWLIERGQTSIRDLIAKMRRSAAAILGEEAATFSVRPDDFRDRTLTLFFLRHFFLAFKETLNNVRKHAAASEVRVRIMIEDRSMSFEVEDNGIGFDPAGNPRGGHGLNNLRRRAGRLGGECRVESRPGEGTRVFFKASIDSKSS